MATTEHDTARRIVVSYPDELSRWGRDQVETDRYKGYLRRMLDDVSEGFEFEEFVDVGCCGNTLDVPFRVESIDGPSRVGPGTEIAFTERRATMAGGWLVQSAGAPDPSRSDGT
ncbi:hypothetical protein ACNS7O_04835 [Haloferacaceae archaeon DSL9]